MPTDLDALEAVLDDVDFGEFDEAYRRPPLQTPSRRSSFAPRTPPAAASQGQVQAATRSLDTKIETLSNAIKTLETRTNAVSAKLDRTANGLAREAVQRKKAEEGIRADIQQTRMLAVLLPTLAQTTVPAVDSTGTTRQVVTQSSGGLGSLLPLLFILPGMTQGDGSKGGLGGDMLTTLLMFKVLQDK